MAAVRRHATLILPPLVVAVAVIASWVVVAEFVLSPAKRSVLLPLPQDVLRQGFLDWRNFKEILDAVLRSARVALIGFAIATGLGVSLAIAMSQSSLLERAIYPYAVMLQTIPILAITPLIAFTFGFNLRSRVLVCVLIALFPIITNTLFGMLSADIGLHDLLTLYEAGRLSRLWRLQLPAALPAIFTGLRIAAGLSVIGAVVGDFFFRQGTPGVGVLIDVYRSRVETERLYAAVIMASLLGLVIFLVVGWLSRRVTRHWYEPTRGQH